MNVNIFLQAFRCKKKHGNTKLVACTPNVNRRVSKTDLPNHYQHCSDCKLTVLVRKYGEILNKFLVVNEPVSVKESSNDFQRPLHNLEEDIDYKNKTNGIWIG